MTTAPGRKEKDTTDFFLAGRKMTWIPLSISSLATALSALTFIGVPGAAYGGNFIYLQMWFGNVIGAYWLAVLFLLGFEAPALRSFSPCGGMADAADLKTMPCLSCV